MIRILEEAFFFPSLSYLMVAAEVDRLVNGMHSTGSGKKYHLRVYDELFVLSY